MKICNLIHINELSVNFDLQEKYFLHIHCWEPPQIRRVSTGLTGLLWYGVRSTRVDTKINGHEDKRFSEICIFSLNKQK